MAQANWDAAADLVVTAVGIAVVAAAAVDRRTLGSDMETVAVPAVV